MILTVAIIRRIIKGKPPAAHIQSIVDAVNTYGAENGLDQPHRITQFLAQVFHESGGLVYFKEIWGPTAAQKRYEGRKDLGNTQKGDGSKFRGFGPIQLTGRDNVTRFYKWCLKKGYKVPDFVADPSKIALPEWAGLSAIWFWVEGNRTRKSLNILADRGDIETITEIVNGGHNGFSDRIAYYVRSALVYLGYGVLEIEKFQKDYGFSKEDQDGIAGPKTRSAMHVALTKLTEKSDQAAGVRAAPVVVMETEVVTVAEPTVPKSIDTQVKKQSNFLGNLTAFGGLLGTVGAFFAGIDWKSIVAMGGLTIVFVLVIFLLRHQIIATIKEVRSEVEA